ncbi:kinase [Micractinium conductrix]|uniref:Kinase n=1 Tax=Micractinium conductrix TaxID=554055 RepID=A0A2P6VC51_9CHLO|nr:kinase [Micractinium conductrix]|eukprot:PSC71659.1 kinase [Micractinium conductrix]
MFPSTEWALSHRRAVAVAAAATGALAVVLLVRRARRRAAQPRRKLDEEEESDYEEEEAAITTLAQLRALRAPLLPLAAPAVASVCVTGHSLHLAAFPPALCALRGLRELDLRGNAIPALPAGVGRLVQLTRLCLSGNLLTELPPQIGKLQMLVDLDVGSNRLAALPAELGQVTTLRFLNAMNNRLEALPDTIGDCTALVRLGLKSNRLAALPASIGRLHGLVELYLTDNLLEELPAEMGQLRSLVKLQASFNPLRALPAELGRLPNLEMIRVASCNIAEVPAALRDAPKLAWMSLASNPACRTLSPRKLPTVEVKDLNMGRKLGDGASGEVFEGCWQGRRVAVKVFVAERSPDGHSRDEMAIAFCVNETHLVKVVAQLKQPLGLVMEFAQGSPFAEKPNLQSLLRCRWGTGQTFELAFILRVAIGVASALEHMHYRGIAHGDVYAHNVMVSEEGHATLCDYGASFPYHKGGPVSYEAHEVRAFGLMLADMVRRMDIGFQGMEQLLNAQKELLAVVQQCCSGPPALRPTFGAVGRRLKTIQKAAALAGLANVTPRSGAASLASLTPRTCVTEFFSPRSDVTQTLHD